MCSLVMSLCLHNLRTCDITEYYYNTLNIKSDLTYTAPGFYMVKHQLVKIEVLHLVSNNWLNTFT